MSLTSPALNRTLWKRAKLGIRGWNQELATKGSLILVFTFRQGERNPWVSHRTQKSRPLAFQLSSFLHQRLCYQSIHSAGEEFILLPQTPVDTYCTRKQSKAQVTFVTTQYRDGERVDKLSLRCTLCHFFTHATHTPQMVSLMVDSEGDAGTR